MLWEVKNLTEWKPCQTLPNSPLPKAKKKCLIIKRRKWGKRLQVNNSTCERMSLIYYQPNFIRILSFIISQLLFNWSRWGKMSWKLRKLRRKMVLKILMGKWNVLNWSKSRISKVFQINQDIQEETKINKVAKEEIPPMATTKVMNLPLTTMFVNYR